MALTRALKLLPPFTSRRLRAGPCETAKILGSQVSILAAPEVVDLWIIVVVTALGNKQASLLERLQKHITLGLQLLWLLA